MNLFFFDYKIWYKFLVHELLNFNQYITKAGFVVVIIV